MLCEHPQCRKRIYELGKPGFIPLRREKNQSVSARAVAGFPEEPHCGFIAATAIVMFGENERVEVVPSEVGSEWIQVPPRIHRQLIGRFAKLKLQTIKLVAGRLCYALGPVVRRSLRRTDEVLAVGQGHQKLPDRIQIRAGRSKTSFVS